MRQQHCSQLGLCGKRNPTAFKKKKKPLLSTVRDGFMQDGVSCRSQAHQLPCTESLVLRVPTILQDCPRRQDLGVCCCWLWRCAGGAGIPRDKKEQHDFVLASEGTSRAPSPSAGCHSSGCHRHHGGTLSHSHRGLHQGRRERGWLWGQADRQGQQLLWDT